MEVLEKGGTPQPIPPDVKTQHVDAGFMPHLRRINGTRRKNQGFSLSEDKNLGYNLALPLRPHHGVLHSDSACPADLQPAPTASPPPLAPCLFPFSPSPSPRSVSARPNSSSWACCPTSPGTLGTRFRRAACSCRGTRSA